MANELATAYLTLVPSLKGAQKTIERELDSAGLRKVGEKEGEKLGDGMSKTAGTKLKSGLKTAAAAAGALALTAFTAAFNIGRQSLNAYAEYEQLVGGVETLFKDSSGKLQEYAAGAYRTANMSANEYMEMSTSFAASLIQSLEGDTEAAVEYANKAITDMSDNANKMGTDITMIQNAYQGFAKQNYTMLDNLKLGYGGTRTEMERLLADAEAIMARNGEMVDYSIDSFADIVDAIHVIQDEMEITGTTAEEAEDTISGSIASAKAAWENWLVALADGNADIEQSTREMVDSVTQAASNIVPRLGEIIATLLDVLGDAVGDMLVKGREWMVGLASGIDDGFWYVLSEIGRGINEGVQRIRDKIESFAQAGRDLISGLVRGLRTAPVNPASAIGNVADSMLNKALSVFDINSPSKAFERIGEQNIEGLIVGTKNKASDVLNTMGSIAEGAIGASSFSATPQLATAGADAGAGSTTIIFNCDIKDLQGIQTLNDLYDVLARARAINPTRR